MKEQSLVKRINKNQEIYIRKDDVNDTVNFYILDLRVMRIVSSNSVPISRSELLDFLTNSDEHMEDKQAICDALLTTLQLTRRYENIQ